MSEANPMIEAAKPKSAFEKPLQADFKGLFKALAKGVGHTAVGKWEELGNDTVEALRAIGLSTEPSPTSPTGVDIYDFRRGFGV